MNNRKVTRGRKHVHQQIITEVKAKTQLGYDIHASEIHINTIDPITGNYTTSKEGNAKILDRVIVHEKGDIVRYKTHGIKHNSNKS